MRVGVIGMIIFLFIVGCVPNNQNISITKNSKEKLYSRLDSIDFSSIEIKSNVLYFFDTKGVRFYADNSMYSKPSKKWVDVKVIDKNGNEHMYSVMKSPVYLNEYELTNISYDDMAKFCFNKYKGFIVSIFVFEEARKRRQLYPASRYEILTPVDMD